MKNQTFTAHAFLSTPEMLPNRRTVLLSDSSTLMISEIPIARQTTLTMVFLTTGIARMLRVAFETCSVKPFSCQRRGKMKIQAMFMKQHKSLTYTSHSGGLISYRYAAIKPDTTPLFIKHVKWNKICIQFQSIK